MMFIVGSVFICCLLCLFVVVIRSLGSRSRSKSSSRSRGHREQRRRSYSSSSSSSSSSADSRKRKRSRRSRFDASKSGWENPPLLISHIHLSLHYMAWGLGLFVHVHKPSLFFLICALVSSCYLLSFEGKFSFFFSYFDWLLYFKLQSCQSAFHYGVDLIRFLLVWDVQQSTPPQRR